MKQNIINILCIISLLSVTNAGLIKDERTCYDHDGKIIPCKLKITKKEDYGFKTSPKKRGLFSDAWDFGLDDDGILGGLFGHHHDHDDCDACKDIDDDDFDSHIHTNDDDFSNNWDNNDDSFEGHTHTNDDFDWSNNNDKNDSFGDHNHTNDDFNDDSHGITNNDIDNIEDHTQNNDFNDDTHDIPNNNDDNIEDQTQNNDFNDDWNFDDNQGRTSTGNSVDVDDIEEGLNDEGVDRSSSGSYSSSTYTGSVKLPINDLTMTDFHGCTSYQASTLQSLIDDITTYRAAADYVLNHLNEDSAFDQIFLKYFHDHKHLSYIQKTFGSVNKMSSAEAYCESASNGICGDRAIAYTYEDSREFHVCPDFFNYPMYGTINDRQSEAAAIVLHELTHCYGTDDHAYSETNCLALSSEKAANNADTYRLFAMKSIYYLNERGSGKSFKKMMLSKDDKIDFRPSSFKDRVLPAKNKKSNRILSKKTAKNNANKTPKIIYKRDFENFLNEHIDFRDIPVKDKIIDRSERH